MGKVTSVTPADDLTPSAKETRCQWLERGYRLSHACNQAGGMVYTIVIPEWKRRIDEWYAQMPPDMKL